MFCILMNVVYVNNDKGTICVNQKVYLLTKEICEILPLTIVFIVHYKLLYS